MRYFLRVDEVQQFEVCWDRWTVWINGPDGANVARFCRHHYELRPPIADQESTGLSCYRCTLLPDGATLDEAWDEFSRALEHTLDLRLPERPPDLDWDPPEP